MISFCFFFFQIVFPLSLSRARSTLSNSRSRVDDSVHVGTEAKLLRFDAVIEHPPRRSRRPEPGSTTTTNTLNTAKHRSTARDAMRCDAMRSTPSYAVERNASIATVTKRNEAKRKKRPSFFFGRYLSNYNSESNEGGEMSNFFFCVSVLQV